MIVVDTSAIVSALVDQSPPGGLRERLAGEASLHVPHLMDTECLSAFRGLVRGRVITAHRAADAIRDLDRLPLVRYPAHPLASRVWELRDKLTAYDATFVALAEILGCPLVTCDRKLTTRGHQADVEVFA